jgi:hypothetical protein
MALGKRVRFEILKRDDFKCQYCGRTSKEVTLEVDHIIAKAQGGSDLPENLLAACFDCNRGKSKISLGHTLVLKRDLKKEKAALKKAKAIMDHDAEQARLLEELTDEMMKNFTTFLFEYPEQSRASMKYFLKKLGKDGVCESMDRTSMKWGASEHGMSRVNLFKYFCGVCHNKIKGWK